MFYIANIKRSHWKVCSYLKALNLHPTVRGVNDRMYQTISLCIYEYYRMVMLKKITPFKHVSAIEASYI